MRSNYDLLDDETLQSLIEQTRRNFAHLKKQSASYGGSMYVPLSLLNQLREVEADLQELLVEFDRRVDKGLRVTNQTSISSVLTNNSVISKADVVIITALEEEREAVLEKLPNARRHPLGEQDIHVYYEATITSQNPPTRTYKVVVLSLLGMGRVNAANATHHVIQRWQPGSVVLVGIAGGIATAGVALGDVIVADQIIDYELQKITPEGPKVRYEVYRPTAQWLAIAQNIRKDDWESLIRVPRPKVGQAKRHLGPIATGDKIVAFETAFAQHQAAWPKLLGVEMEAGGVASAAFQQAHPPGFFMVRGVSDLADNKKNTTAVAAWRDYACDVAASYAVGLITSGLLPIKIKS